MDVSIGLPVEFYVRLVNFWRNFGIVQIAQNALTIVRLLFWVHLSNSFDCYETYVVGVFEGAVNESVLKIKVAQLSGAPCPISARNLGITRERWFVRSFGRLHWVSGGILRKVKELLQKFWNSSNCAKFSYYSNGTFLGSFVEFLRL